MKALLLFHLKAGARVALRSFAILFSTILALIMIDMNPAGVVRSYTGRIFSSHPSASDMMPIVVLAFVLPVLAAPRLAHGLDGWIRHLPFDSTMNRRGMAAALLVGQIPIAVMLAGLAVVAIGLGLPAGMRALGLLVILSAGAIAALPARRRYLLLPAGVGSALLAIDAGWVQLLIAVVLLAAAEAICGPLRPRRKRSWRTAASMLNFGIGWRALGWRMPAILVVALAPLGCAGLFIRNNDLPLSIAHGAARLGGIFAAALVFAGMANKLAERRPAWPLARSFPWSASHRVDLDALFTVLHAVIPVLVVAVFYPLSAVHAVTVMPFLAFRAAEYIRVVPRLPAGARRLVAEGAGVAALVALLPWLCLVFLAAAPLARLSARESEQSIKATGWQDLHHAPIGDTFSWSD